MYLIWSSLFTIIIMTFSGKKLLKQNINLPHLQIIDLLSDS